MVSPTIGLYTPSRLYIHHDTGWYVMRFAKLCILIFLLPTMAWGGPLHLAFEHYPPFEYASGGKVVGRNVALLDEVSRRLDVELEYVEIPFARALYDAENGNIDGVFSLFRTVEREKFLYYVEEPLGETETAVVTKVGSSVVWNGLESLRNYHVGCVRGYVHGCDVDSMRGLHMTKVKDNTLLVKMLECGHIDIAICNLDVVRYTHDMQKCDWRIEVLEKLVRKPLFIGFSRKLGERGRRLAREFSDELRKIKREGSKAD